MKENNNYKTCTGQIATPSFGKIPDEMETGKVRNIPEKFRFLFRRPEKISVSIP